MVERKKYINCFCNSYKEEFIAHLGESSLEQKMCVLLKRDVCEKTHRN